jgi:hypothetical protein
LQLRAAAPLLCFSGKGEKKKQDNVVFFWSSFYRLATL